MSSSQGSGYPATTAKDDSFYTSWSIATSDSQRQRVDHGATCTINQDVLAWETAYAAGRPAAGID